uniref:Uncharacterized protein n=1 Tax=Pundamilia nyererei TaxID=303518 RepID=A0A3B4F3D3_9CICH
MFYPFLQQKPAPQIAPSPTPAPHILYNPTQHMLTYPNFCPSGQSQLPSQVLPQPQPQGATQDPGGYMLTPNAPVLYASSYSAFEKPPPYAC